MRAPVFVVAASVLSLGLVACVLFVPSPDETAGSTCGLTSDELVTSCGGCVASKCKADLDRCCAEGRVCESVIPAVVLCESKEEKCAPAGDGGPELDLRACASTACAASCGDGAAPTKDGGATEVVCESNAERCFCRALTDAGSSSGTCSSKSHVACCAENGYPGIATRVCACVPRYCLRNRADRTCKCTYFTSSSSDAVSLCSTGSGVCCRGEENRDCTCYDDLSSCPSGTTETALCSEDDLACLREDDGGTSKSVSSCSR